MDLNDPVLDLEDTFSLAVEDIDVDRCGSSIPSSERHKYAPEGFSGQAEHRFLDPISLGELAHIKDLENASPLERAKLNAPLTRGWDNANLDYTKDDSDY